MILERQTVHISDDSGRIAMLEKRTVGMDDAKEVLTRYVYSNHIQSASLELDETAAIISYEEYHPYGTTAFQAKSSTINAVAKRYRYTGKERDEESGLYYHGARYYIPWLARWTASDPLENKYAGMSPYNYSFNNPIIFNDPSGMEGEEQIGNWVRTSEGKVRYNSKVNSLEDATRSYGDGASIFKVGDSYTSNTGNEIVLGMNGKFTKNGALQTSPDDRANYVEDKFKLTNFGRAFEAQRLAEAAAESYFLKTKFLLADGSTMTGTQIRRAEYERVEAGGAAIRNVFFGAAGALTYQAAGLDPMRGAVVFSVFDGAAMFAAGNAGAPYGKPTLMYEQMPSQSATGRNMPYIPVVKSDATIMNFAGKFSVGTNRALEVSSPNSTYVQKNNSGDVMGMYFYNTKGNLFSKFHFIQESPHKVKIEGMKFDLKNHPHEHQTRWLTAPNGNLYEKKQVRLISPT